MDRIKLRITKIDAARRQLDMAIELWFHEKDQVSIHALAAAAYQIVHDINAQKSSPQELMYNSNIVVEEHRKSLIKLLKEPMNFFKHADKDADGEIEFSPSLSISYMLFAITGLQHLGQPPSDAAHALLQWLSFHEPQWMNASYVERLRQMLGVDGLAQIRQLPKPAFLDVMRQGARAASGQDRLSSEALTAQP